MRRRAGIALAVLLLGPALAPIPPEPPDYRTEDYRSPTPAGLKGATTIDSADAVALWSRRSAVFIDVMPQPPRPANLPAGTLWRQPPRDSIPGAIWLPNVGFGDLAPETEAYFRRGLTAATRNDPSRPIVIFCMRDCWMSWNAAKRTLSYGYTAVHWFPDGTDGWRAAGQNLVRIEPMP